MLGLALVVVRFDGTVLHRIEWHLVTLLTVVAMISLISPESIYLQESWAAAFIILSLAARTDRRWWPAVVLGTIALFFREIAMPYVLAMLVLALVQRRWREAATWLAGVVLFLGFYGWHVQQVLAHQVPEPTAATTWFTFGGWPFIVDSVGFSSVLRVAPHAVLAVLLALALAGWLFDRGPVALRFGATAAAFIACFMVVGRIYNVYWGLVYIAVLLPGLAFVPSGAVAIWRVLTQRPAVAAAQGSRRLRPPDAGAVPDGVTP